MQVSVSITAVLQHFLGIWRLDPDQSRYEAGPPPLDGAYTLSYDGVHLHFDIEWTGADGTTQRQAIDAVPDGQEHPYPGPVVDSVCYTVVDQGHVRGVDIFRIEAGKIGEKLSYVKG
jgi:hypothetical protein